MNKSKSLLSIVFASVLHGQAATGCDLRMFAGARLFAAPRQLNMAIAADFNHDGFPDLAVLVFQATSTISILLNNGDGTFRAAGTVTTSNSSWVGAADFNGDGFADLVYTSNQSTVIMLGNGDGTFQNAVRYPVSRTGALGVVMADFNGDGNLDIATVTKTDQMVTVLLGKGDGTFRDPVVYGAGVGPLELAVGDLNGDGKPDLVITDDASAGVWPLLNNYLPGGAASSCAAVAALSN